MRRRHFAPEPDLAARQRCDTCNEHVLRTNNHAKLTIISRR
jgi:hypothetical protein